MGVLGAIVGDIAGSQYEFTSIRPKNLDWEHCPIFSNKCRFTDDTVMTIATMEAIHENCITPNFQKWYRLLGQKYNKAGYGGMFRKWIYSDNPQPYNSFGNGSAMRVSYVGEAYASLEGVVQTATDSAKVTHNHNQGIKGAVVTAVLNYMAREGYSKEEMFEYMVRYYGNPDVYEYPVILTLDEIREKYKWDVTCQGSVPAAFVAFYESNSYESFIRNVFSLPCDMDTLCAIGGSFAQEFYYRNREKDFINDYQSILITTLDDYLLNCLSKEYNIDFY